MTAVLYPNPSAPAPHVFAVDVPDGWRTRPVAQGIMRFTPDEHDPAFRPAITIVSGRIAGDLDLRRVGRTAIDRIARVADDVEIDTGKVGGLHDRQTYIQAISFTVRESGLRLTQMIAVFYGPTDAEVRDEEGRTITDLYTVTCTCLQTEALLRMPPFLQVAGSITFGPRLVVAPRAASDRR